MTSAASVVSSMAAPTFFMRRIATSWTLLATLAIAPSVVAAAATAPIVIAEGKGSFVFVDAAGDPSKRMTVYTYLPPGVDAATARIVFVMHGVSKNADGYRDVWIPYADRERWMIVAPLFDAGQWRNVDYASGGVIERDRSRWSFSVVEHLFDAIEQATGNAAPRYSIYGHSEGAQFVHRLVLMLPDARIDKAIAANAGWYTMPDADVRYPFGIGGSPIDDATLARSFRQKLTVLLGDRDVDPNHRQLNRTPPAMAEGSNRFERGQRFFNDASARAASLGDAFAWRLQVVTGVAHRNSGMSRAAAALLAPPD